MCPLQPKHVRVRADPDTFCCRGFALGYRQRRPGDPFLGSPWWSISVEWEDHNTDRK